MRDYLFIVDSVKNFRKHFKEWSELSDITFKCNCAYVGGCRYLCYAPKNQSIEDLRGMKFDGILEYSYTLPSDIRDYLLTRIK